MLIQAVSYLSDFPQRSAELIDHDYPIGILQNSFAQKCGLGGRPEGGVGKTEIGGEWEVASDEALNGVIVIGEP